MDKGKSDIRGGPLAHGSNFLGEVWVKQRG
jgi:hypothetical protein